MSYLGLIIACDWPGCDNPDCKFPGGKTRC